MATLWTIRGQSRIVLAQWTYFRARVAQMQDSGGEEAEVGNRLTLAVNELRKNLVVCEDVLVKDLEEKVLEMRRILDRIEVASQEDNPKLLAGALQTAITSSQTVLLVWSQQEEHAPMFWGALAAFGVMQLQEAKEKILPQDVWTLWRNGFEAVLAWAQLGRQTSSAGGTESKTFKALVDELISCLSELLMAALPVLSRTLSYPLVLVDEEIGEHFGKVYIGGYEALQMCIKNQPRTVAMSREDGATGRLGSLLVDMAKRLQEQVLSDIHSTSKNLECASAEETKEVAELIEALNSLDFDLTRWNFMRPCVSKMSMSPGAVGEMMKKLLGLADRVRTARDAKDLQHLRSFITRTLVAKTVAAVPARAGALDVTSTTRPETTDQDGRRTSTVAQSLQLGAEITVGLEYHQVKSIGPSIGLVTRLRDSLEPATDVNRLEVSPFIPIAQDPKGYSQAFLDTVENFNAQHQDSADDIVKRHYGWLPTDVKARKIALLTMYTVNSLYCDVNRALYDNDREWLWSNAGFIRELRDVFLVGQTSPIVEPFIGDVVRSLMVDNHKLPALSNNYAPGQAVCWASFTSTSNANELKGRHDGNVIFRISCARMGPPSPGQFSPSVVKAFSAFPSEDEIIFPPHCFFRMINAELKEGTLTFEMETTEFLDVWSLIRDEDWTSFELWASRHPEMVDTRARKFSMICAVAQSISKPLDEGGGVPNPFEVCLRYGADVHELNQKDTPFAILSQKLARADSSDRPMYEDWLSFLRKNGAR